MQRRFKLLSAVSSLVLLQLGCAGGCSGGDVGVQLTVAISSESGAAGQVTSAPEGISCGEQCVAGFAPGTQIRLEAVPANDASRFAGWTGACAGSPTPVCELELTSNQTVGAAFELRTVSLAVEVSPPGAGLIRLRGGSKFCAGSCTWHLPYGTTVELLREPGQPFRTESWTGGCAGAPDLCTLELTADATVGATFVSRPRVDVRLAGATGVGSVTVTGQSMPCVADCSFWVDPGAQLSLAAAGGTEDDVFRGWDPPCGVGAECSLVVDGDVTLTANFASVHTWSRTIPVHSSIAADSEGHVWVAGEFRDPIDFGSGTLFPPTFATYTVVGARFLPDGELQWARRFGGTGEARATSIAVNPSGGAYIGGAFNGSIQVGQSGLSSAGGHDALLIELATSGEVTRIGQFGSGADDPFLFLADEPSQVLAAIGSGSHTVTQLHRIDSGSLQPSWSHAYPVSGRPAVSPNGQITAAVAAGLGTAEDVGCSTLLPPDAWGVASYAPDGSCLWVYLPQQGTWFVREVAAAPDGQVVVAGTFNDQLVLGSTTLGTNGATGQGFVAVLSSAGALQWARHLSHDGNASSYVQPNAVAVGENGTVFVVGAARGGVNFGGGQVYSKLNVAFAVSLSLANGQHVRTQFFPSETGTSSFFDAAALPRGRFAVTGYFTDTFDLGGGPLVANGPTGYLLGVVYP